MYLKMHLFCGAPENLSHFVCGIAGKLKIESYFFIDIVSRPPLWTVTFRDMALCIPVNTFFVKEKKIG